MKKQHKNLLILLSVFLLGVMLSTVAKEHLVKLPVIGKYFI